MKLRFKILLALMFPMMIILSASAINLLINYGETLPQMHDYQMRNTHFLFKSSE